MKSPISIIGIVLIILGVIALSYQSFTYPKQENVLQVGDLKVTSQTDKRVNIPPYVGGLAIAAGLVLVVVGRRK